jgi:hypothetical protein
MDIQQSLGGGGDEKKHASSTLLSDDEAGPHSTADDELLLGVKALDSEERKSIWYLIGLTLIFGGIQFGCQSKQTKCNAISQMSRPFVEKDFFFLLSH